MSSTHINQVKVSLQFSNQPITVGKLVIRDRHIYFEYDINFLKTDLEISPFHLKREPGVKQFDHTLFSGLPGVFNDSLPDGWGRLLLDRFMRSKGFLPNELTSLDRLAHVGKHGMGALIYEPDESETDYPKKIDLNKLAIETKKILNDSADNVIQELLALNGSSAGARPKVILGVSKSKKELNYGADELANGFEHWLIKFPNTQDGLDAGAIEYIYSLMAKKAGIDMPETFLFPAKQGPGFFGVKRFDRDHNNRLHTHTACGLLHSDFRLPSLDYIELLNLTTRLTKNNEDVVKLFRLAVFNVMAHNRDDHSKNFSFLMDAKGAWHLSPAYDLTFSSGPGGEQSTMVMGEGKNPDKTHLTQLGETAGLSKNKIETIFEQTSDALSQWKKLANKHAISKANIDQIHSKLKIA